MDKKKKPRKPMPKEKKLSLKDELFCQYYAKSGIAFSNARKSYALAFSYDITNEKHKDICDSLSFRLLSKVKVYNRVNELLSEKIDDEIVDKELSKVIKQDTNPHAKVSAISEYNKVKRRVSENTHLVINVIGEIADKNGIKTTNTSTKRNS